MAKARKDFTNNPAMNFISQESIDKVEHKPAGKTGKAKASTTTGAGKGKVPEGYKVNPEYIETKSRRVQLLIQPSVYDALKARAQAEGISVNEVINTALKKYTER